MKYLKVDWHQDNPDFPILIYSEIDDQGWEVRKVEVFSSGVLEFAGDAIRLDQLSEVRMPTLVEIAADPQFTPKEITQDEFEEMWSKAVSSPSTEKRSPLWS